MSLPDTDMLLLQEKAKKAFFFLNNYISNASQSWDFFPFKNFAAEPKRCQNCKTCERFLRCVSYYNVRSLVQCNSKLGAKPSQKIQEGMRFYSLSLSLSMQIVTCCVHCKFPRNRACACVQEREFELPCIRAAL